MPGCPHNLLRQLVAHHSMGGGVNTAGIWGRTATNKNSCCVLRKIFCPPHVDSALTSSVKDKCESCRSTNHSTCASQVAYTCWQINQCSRMMATVLQCGLLTNTNKYQIRYMVQCTLNGTHYGFWITTSFPKSSMHLCHTFKCKKMLLRSPNRWPNC